MDTLNDKSISIIRSYLCLRDKLNVQISDLYGSSEYNRIGISDNSFIDNTDSIIKKTIISYSSETEYYILSFLLREYEAVLSGSYLLEHIIGLKNVNQSTQNIQMSKCDIFIPGFKTNLINITHGHAIMDKLRYFVLNSESSDLIGVHFVKLLGMFSEKISDCFNWHYVRGLCVDFLLRDGRNLRVNFVILPCKDIMSVCEWIDTMFDLSFLKNHYFINDYKNEKVTIHITELKSVLYKMEQSYNMISSKRFQKYHDRGFSIRRKLITGLNARNIALTRRFINWLYVLMKTNEKDNKEYLFAERHRRLFVLKQNRKACTLDNTNNINKKIKK